MKLWVRDGMSVIRRDGHWKSLDTKDQKRHLHKYFQLDDGSRVFPYFRVFKTEVGALDDLIDDLSFSLRMAQKRRQEIDR